LEELVVGGERRPLAVVAPLATLAGGAVRVAAVAAANAASAPVASSHDHVDLEIAIIGSAFPLAWLFFFFFVLCIHSSYDNYYTYGRPSAPILPAVSILFIRTTCMSQEGFSRAKLQIEKR